MRSEVALKVVCGVAAAFLLYRVGLAVAHINPLFHVKIPALPTLASGTNAPSQKGTNNAMANAGKPSTNISHQVTAANGTNHITGTNLVTAGRTHSVGGTTNRTGTADNQLSSATNRVAPTSNQVALVTNKMAPALTSASPGSNQPPRTEQKAGSNVVASSQQTRTNLTASMPLGVLAGPPGMPPGMPPCMFPGMPGGRPGMPAPGPALPPEVQARIDRVIESEILAPIMRPMPMALLGIAGQNVFLRAPNGQTGLINEGEELGGVKLLRIAVNRVLVEEQGQRKELTIFSGLGSESLLSPQNESPK